MPNASFQPGYISDRHNYDDQYTTSSINEMTNGLGGLRDRIAKVPKRVELGPPVEMSHAAEDFAQASQDLKRVESGLQTLWPAD